MTTTATTGTKGTVTLVDTTLRDGMSLSLIHI